MAKKQVNPYEEYLAKHEVTAKAGAKHLVAGQKYTVNIKTARLFASRGWIEEEIEGATPPAKTEAKTEAKK